MPPLRMEENVMARDYPAEKNPKKDEKSQFY
jgi:hypothetical protein